MNEESRVRYLWRSDEIDRFWKFVFERHSIWNKRFILEEKYPWTDDPILRKHKFTNIYRELDPGTQYSIQNIMEQDLPKSDRVFNVMMYRLMCNIDTFDGWSVVEDGVRRIRTVDEFNEQEFNSYLKEIYDTGYPVFGNAYLISPYSSMGSPYKYENVSRLFGLLKRNFVTLTRTLFSATSFEGCYKAINKHYGFGPFLAYQVCVDLTYPLSREGGRGILPFSQDNWAMLGPGAKRGFSRVSSNHDQLGGLRALRAQQREEFHRLELDFPFLRGEDINLANLQNCFCEFHKYRSLQMGTGKAQRIYTPEGR